MAPSTGTASPVSNSAVWTFVTRIAIVLCVAVATWVWTIEHRVTLIESNRFTYKDGEALQNALNLKADKSDAPSPIVTMSLAALNEDLEEVKADLSNVKKEVSGNRDRLVRIETKLDQVLGVK